jgi:RHS repeat-associated protein
VLGGGVTRSFTYGDSGNVTLDDLAGAATTLVYNAMDRLTRVEAGAVTLAEYTYAATGQRAIRDVAGAVTHYLHDPGGALYAETDGASTVLREYITLGGATIAIIDAGGVSYVHNDPLATPQVMTDGAGATVWDASYRPFGQAAIAGLAANAQRFPGQTADAETGYYDNWHRTYDPSIGRYLQSDPIGLAAGFNTYAYAHGNPVMYADPTGQIVPFLIWGLMAMQAAVAAIEFGVTFYYATETLLAIYERYQAGCEVGDLVGAWDVVALIPVLRYVRMAGRLARSGRAPALAAAGGRAAKPLVPTRATGTGTPLGGGGGGHGPFSIIDWTGYPTGLPRPKGPFRVIEGQAYNDARAAANAANNALRKKNNLRGQPVEIHEIHPVKLGGDPAAKSNKIVLPRDVHRREVTPWWNKLLKDVSG